MYNLLVAQNFFHNKHFNFFQNTFDIIVIHFISYFLDVVLRPMADPRQVSSSLLASDSPMSSSKWQIFFRENIDSNMFTSNYLNSLIYSFKSFLLPKKKHHEKNILFESDKNRPCPKMKSKYYLLMVKKSPTILQHHKEIFNVFF